MDDTGLIKHNAHALVTYTGVEFDPFDVKPGDVRIEDIAHALARICRFGGHVVDPVFHSVAAHSMRVSNICGQASVGPTQPLIMLNGLLHDATEAYLGDIVRPLKYRPEFAFYQEVEEDLHRHIMNQLGIGIWGLQIVRRADNDALLNELDLRGADFSDMLWARASHIEQVEEDFLLMYRLLKEML